MTTKPAASIRIAVTTTTTQTLRKEVLDHGLVGLLFGFLEIPVGVRHGYVHQFRFRQIVDQGRRQSDLAVVLVRLLLEKEQNEKRQKM